MAAGFRGGGAIHRKRKQKKILLDSVEDAVGTVGRSLRVVVVPTGHVLRLGFGLSLTFYGMAFRTLAFHVIVFRIAGLRQVR